MCVRYATEVQAKAVVKRTEKETRGGGGVEHITVVTKKK
jgi:hypothetical protein